MPSITFNETGLEALRLHQLTESLTGDDGHFKAREKLRERILKAWPELMQVGADESEEAARMAALKEKRPIELSPEIQTALAEGFLKIIQDSKRTDGEKSPYVQFAKKCKFSTWLSKQMDKKTVKEFAESDEAVEPDAEEAPAPAPQPPEHAVSAIAKDMEETKTMVAEAPANG